MKVASPVLNGEDEEIDMIQVVPYASSLPNRQVGMDPLGKIAVDFLEAFRRLECVQLS